MVGTLTDSTKETSSGGMKSVLKVEGVLESLDRVPPGEGMTGFGGKTPNDQAKIVLADAVILEMEPGEEAPELKEDKFTFWLGFAPSGKGKPHPNTFYVKGWVQSFEDAGTSPSAMIGERIVLTKKDVMLFKRPKKDNPEEYDESWSKNFCYDPEDGGSAAGIDEYIRGQVVGLNAPAVTRWILKDDRAKNSQYRELVRGDFKEFAAMLDLEVGEDGKLADPVTAA